MRSSSATAWEEYKTVAPVSWQASNIEPRNSRRASGSRLAIGSSSKNSSGLLASTRVRATWARSPPDRALIRARGRMPSRPIRSAATTASNPRFMQRPMSRTSATRSRGHSGASWATNPIRSSRWAGAPPAASTIPSVTGSRPAAMLISVVLPEPFGPTRATTRPAGTSTATHFGRQMRKERLARGWSLREFSARTGINIGHASRIENGKRPPTENVAAACDAAFPERKGWFTEYYNELRGWSEVPAAFRNWSELEENATALRVWKPGIMHGLLQTGDYARA